jgi:hypothetical protein
VSAYGFDECQDQQSSYGPVNSLQRYISHSRNNSYTVINCCTDRQLPVPLAAVTQALNHAIEPRYCAVASNLHRLQPKSLHGKADHKTATKSERFFVRLK